MLQNVIPPSAYVDIFVTKLSIYGIFLGKPHTWGFFSTEMPCPHACPDTKCPMGIAHPCSRYYCHETNFFRYHQIMNNFLVLLANSLPNIVNFWNSFSLFNLVKKFRLCQNVHYSTEHSIFCLCTVCRLDLSPTLCVQCRVATGVRKIIDYHFFLTILSTNYRLFDTL